MKTNQGDRLIFDGNTQFDACETAKILEFRNFAARNHYNLPPICTDNMILRFLHSKSFKMDKALQNIKSHVQWKQTTNPLQLDPRLQQHLNSGAVYIYGRDNQFRPIIVIDMGKLSSSGLDDVSIIKLLTFWLEEVVQEFMLPGQVENWIFIIDLKTLKVSKSATGTMKQVLASLQENYTNRLFSLYMVNAPASVSLPWKMIKKFLDEDTVSKISFCKQSVPETLFLHTHRGQVEQKYGGTAPNLRQFWPIQPNPSSVPVTNTTQAKMVSVETYRDMYRQGSLSNMKVNPKFIQEEPKVQIPAHEPVTTPIVQKLIDKPAINIVRPVVETANCGMAGFIVEPLILGTVGQPADIKIVPMETAKGLLISPSDELVNGDEITRETGENFMDFSNYSENMDDEADYSEYMSEKNANSQYAVKTKVFETLTLEALD